MRQGALGDVILTTPIAQRLHAVNCGARIDVLTGYPEVYKDSPFVDCINQTANVRYDKIIDLNGVYERDPHRHIVRAYMLAAFGDEGDRFDLQQNIFDPQPRWQKPREPKIVVIHGAGATWRNRRQGDPFWLDVQVQLREVGYRTITVGGSDDAGGGDVDLRGRLPLINLWRLIKMAGWFVGSDSGPLHVAGATDTPIIGLFSCARAAYRLPLRSETIPTIGLQPDLDCAGCLHDLPAPVTSCGCRRGDYACVEGGRAIPARSIIEKILAVDTGLR